MECNRDEALRAKEIAERKFNANDITGARKFAVKAQNLFPELKGINQMISALDVYLAAERKVNGENDWYSILSANASATEETLKKQYRSLALQLHPDKNMFTGAEGAFKLITEAWSVLSDKSTRLKYDQKMNLNAFQQETPQSHEDHSVQSPANVFYEFAEVLKQSTQAMNHNGASAVPPSRSSVSNTFWTCCAWCRMQYQYLKVYLYQNIMCLNCCRSFVAVEIGIPDNAVNVSDFRSATQCPESSSNNSTFRSGYSSGYDKSSFQGASPAEFQHGVNLNPHNNIFNRGFQGISPPEFQHGVNLDPHNNPVHRGSHPRSGGISSTTDTAFQAANFNSPKVNTKRKRHETHSSGIDDSVKLGRNDKVENFATFTESPAVSEVERTKDAPADFPKPRTTRQYNFNKKLSQINIRQLLMEKVRMTTSKKLEEWDSASTAANQKQDQKDSDSDNTEKIHVPVTFQVPDPEFYDFDKDRQEMAFGDGQVWATYDNEDGMPRLYVLVQNVLSLKPFKIRMTFLSSKSNIEFAPIKWVESGYAKTSGDFRSGRYQIGETVNIFSHRMMNWEKGPRGAFKILPKKGDVWALYKNWSPDWNEFTPNDVVRKYEMVEVIIDADADNQEQGVVVAPLIKVAGFKAVFRRHLDAKKTKRIPREEMFRFSHQVPYYMLTGEEAHGSLKGCLELDPASLPEELLQVIAEMKDGLSE